MNCNSPKKSGHTCCCCCEPSGAYPPGWKASQGSDLNGMYTFFLGAFLILSVWMSPLGLLYFLFARYATPAMWEWLFFAPLIWFGRATIGVWIGTVFLCLLPFILGAINGLPGRSNSDSSPSDD